jgi:hypothetical protein
MIPALLFGFIALAILAIVWSRYRRLQRERYIRDYPLPRGLYDKLRKRRPELELRDCILVARGLRQYFLAYLRSGNQFVSMPSQVVDDLWHEFILYTKAYDAFCKEAFGRFLHHTPAVVLSADKQNNAGLRRVWWHACKEENIDPKNPLRLPLLFAIDGKLGIIDGFRYTANCRALRAPATGDGGSVHCGGDFSDSSIDGSTDGLSDSSGESGGDGGSDGGCGGGCGGGGD